MKKLYLEQQLVPLAELTEAQCREVGAKRVGGKEGEWPAHYIVTKIVGSTARRIGEKLSREVVDEYCGEDEWEVIIT